MRLLLLVVFVLLLASPMALAHEESGHAEILHQTYRASGTAEAGGFVEVDLEARGDDTITWSVATTEPVNVNIHEHEMETVYHVQVNETRAANGTFEVPHDGTFSLMVIGLRSASEVDLVLEGPFAIVGSQGLGQEEDAPGAGSILLPALALVLAAVLRRQL